MESRWSPMFFAAVEPWLSSIRKNTNSQREDICSLDGKNDSVRMRNMRDQRFGITETLLATS